MSYTYEVWLTDERGSRLELLEDISYFSYIRQVSKMGTLQIGMPFHPFFKKFNPYFRPDWRVEIWRSPGLGIPLRLEDVFMLRKPNLYTRDDGMDMLRFYGRNGIDLLNRRCVIQNGGTAWATKTDLADDMMKEVVSEQMLYGSALDQDGVVDNDRAYPENEFIVEADAGAGPSVSRSFADKSVYEVLKGIKEETFQLYQDDTTNRRIFFDVEPYITGIQSRPLGWRFLTIADYFGADKSSGTVFSKENENIDNPQYSQNHLDEFNTVYIRGNGTGESQINDFVQNSDRAGVSRWNRIEKVISTSSEASSAGLQSAGNSELEKGKPVQEFPVVFLNTPGSETTPRSLYGVDWDLGDLLPVQYGGQDFNVECLVVSVSIDENGKETITGRNEAQTV